jgi:hypothetical protein
MTLFGAVNYNPAKIVQATIGLEKLLKYAFFKENSCSLGTITNRNMLGADFLIFGKKSLKT